MAGVGKYIYKRADINSDLAWIGVSTTNTPTANGDSSLNFGMFNYAGYTSRIINGGDMGLGNTSVDGNLYCLDRDSSNVWRIMESSDNGTTWTQIGSNLGTLSGTVYLKAGIITSGKFLVDPKAIGAA